MDRKRLSGRRIFCLLLFVPAVAAVVTVPACSSGSMGKDEGLSLPPELAFYQAPPVNFRLPGRPDAAPRNIILMIGDGMGAAQVELARHTGAPSPGRLWMETLPVSCRVKTNNVHDDTTDSAAAVTAIACSVKTKNGMIGQTPDGKDWINIRERLELEGYRSGLVATYAVSHATPAGFGAHVRSRGMEEEIAEQMSRGGVDVILGGGRKFWQRPRTQENVERAGFRLISTGDECNGVDTMPVLGLFQEKEMTTWEPEPSIEEMTLAALRLLSAPEGDGTQPPFFLMVEGSQIDGAGHANDAPNCIRQTLLFDMAVRAAIDFARKDGNTLVIVTADHETGGLVLEPSADDPAVLDYRWTTTGHTSVEVPLFAFGPGALRFAGTIENTDISKTIAGLAGLDDFPRLLTPADREAPVMQTAAP